MPSWHASAKCTNLNDASVVADCLLPVVEERIVAEHAEPFMPGIRVAREIEYLYAAASRDAGDYSLFLFRSSAASGVSASTALANGSPPVAEIADPQ